MNKHERKTVLKTKKLCYICLEPGHVVKICSLDYVCKKYDKKHHVLLQTAIFEVSDLELKNKHFVNALFDSGSQHFYISFDLRNILGLKTLRKERIFIKTFGNKNSRALSVDVVPLKIISNQKVVTLEAICIGVICADLLNQNSMFLLIIHI